MIVDTLEVYKTFENLSYIKSNDGEEIDERYFYNKLRSAVYFALLDMLDVHQTDNSTYKIPEIDENTMYIKTWHFFDKVYHDLRISTETNGEKMVELYRKYYGNICKGIDTIFIHLLKEKINKRFNISEVDLQYLCGLIKAYYCDMP